MSTQALAAFLDAEAVNLANTQSIRAWISPRARSAQLANRRQTRQFTALFSIIDEALRLSGAQVNTASPPTRLVNIELPKLTFWYCRPGAGGPAFLMVIRRSNEDRNWQHGFEQAYNQP